MSQGSNNTSNQSLPQFQTANQDESANFQIQQDLKNAQPQTNYQIQQDPKNVQPQTSYQVQQDPKNAQPQTSYQIQQDKKSVQPQTSYQIQQEPKSVQPQKNYQIQQDPKSAQPQTISSSVQELVKHGPIPESQQQQHNNTSQEVNDRGLPPMSSQDDRQHRQTDQNPLQIPQATGMQIPGKNPVLMQEPDRPHNSDNESQYVKLQKMSNQQATVPEQASNPPARSKQVPFGLLLPVLMNQLDKDKGMQLQELFGKLKVCSMYKFCHKPLFVSLVFYFILDFVLSERRNLERVICPPH